METELAIYEDCLCLINSFAEKQNANFKTFCELWKCMSFQNIYSAQTSVVEIIQTTKTILHLCKRIVCAKDELGKLVSKFKDNKHIFRRIGGFFLIYCIYFKQPTKEYVKLLVSMKTWQDILKFIENLPRNNVLTEEVHYMFWRLYKNDAFVFTALDYEVGLEDLVEYDRLYDIRNGNNSNEVVRVKLKQKLTVINETSGILPEMVNVEENYNKSKKSLIKSYRTIKTLPETKIFNDIQNALKSIHDVLDEGLSHESSIETENELSYDSKKRELKRKATGRCNADENEHETMAENASKDDVGKYCGRLTVRQLMTQELPQKLLDDLKNTSEEEDELDDVDFIENSD